MISVLMSTYNTAKYIRTAISSILNQHYTNFELIIVDDGSNDGTQKIVKSYKDERIKYYYKEHTGLSDSLRFGLNQCKGEFIARFDPDDISLPQRLLLQKNFLDNNFHIDVISCWYALIKREKIICTIQTNIESSLIKKNFAIHSEIVHSGAMFRRNNIIENYLYKDHEIEDYSFWIKYKDKLEFSNVPQILLLVRLHSDSIFSKNIRQRNKILYSIQEPFFNNSLNNYFFFFNYREEYYYKALRELLYGNKSIVRSILINKSILFFNIKSIFAFFISFLSRDLIDRFLEFKLKRRFIYFLTYYTKNNISIRKHLKGIIRTNLSNN